MKTSHVFRPSLRTLLFLEMHKIKILYKNSEILGELHDFEARGESYVGTIEFVSFPHELKNLFEKHEISVNNQLFLEVEKIESQIAMLNFKAIFSETQKAIAIHDLQIMSGNKISFSLGQ